MTPLYELKDVRYGYSWGRKLHMVIHGASLLIPPNSFSCLVGPSGMGKTTLLNLMGLLDRPHGGQIRFNGYDVGILPERKIEEIRLRDLGFIFQSFHLIPMLTVLENTMYFLPSLGLSGKEARERGEEVLGILGIADVKDKKPLELSGGQRQRVAIARALAKGPKVVLADEPTANLDRKTAEGIISIFKKLHDTDGVSFVFSTHDLHLVSFADRVYSLKDGKLEEGRGG